MAILKLSPPPATDDVRVLQAWANELYEQVDFVLKNIGEDNLETDFIDKINGLTNGGGTDGV